MATRNIVPRSTGEGSIGTTVKRWLNGFFDNIKVDQISIENNEVSPEVTNTVNLGTNLKRWLNGFFRNIYVGHITIQEQSYEGNDVRLAQGGTGQTLNVTGSGGIGELQVEGSKVLTVADTSIPSGTKLWIYANAAPIGWTIDSTPSDNILAVKGGSTYTTGGSQQGSWAISGLTSANESGHTHTMPTHYHYQGSHTHAVAAHNHMWYNYTDWNTPSYSYNSAGSSLAISRGPGTAYARILTNIDDWWGLANDFYTSNKGAVATGGATGANTNAANAGNTNAGASHKHTVSQNAAWRPKGNVGIICSKD